MIHTNALTLLVSLKFKQRFTGSCGVPAGDLHASGSSPGVSGGVSGQELSLYIHWLGVKIKLIARTLINALLVPVYHKLCFFFQKGFISKVHHLGSNHACARGYSDRPIASYRYSSQSNSLVRICAENLHICACACLTKVWKNIWSERNNDIYTIIPYNMTKGDRCFSVDNTGNYMMHKYKTEPWKTCCWPYLHWIPKPYSTRMIHIPLHCSNPSSCMAVSGVWNCCTV